MYRNFIFDLYGTLVDIRTDEQDPANWEAYARWADSFMSAGAGLTGAELHAIYDEEVARQAAAPSPYRYPEPDLLPVFRVILERIVAAGGCTREVTDEEVYAAGEQFRRQTTKLLGLYPNTKKVLEGLHAAGKKVCLLSNAQHVFTWQELERLGILGNFDAIFISSDAGVRKPDPAFYEKLFASEGLAKEESIMIGNDSTSDIAGAKAFGIDALYVRTVISPAQDPTPDCRYVYEDGDIGHVLELLEESETKKAKAPSGEYDTILFDLDGTLMNTLEDIRASVNVALAGHGYPERSLEEIRHFVGNGNRVLMDRAVPDKVREDLNTGKLPESLREELFCDFKAHYDIHCNDKTGPYEGIVELLRECKRRGLKMGIASNKVRSAVEKLNDIYFDGLIDAAAGVTESIPTKPDPAMVTEVLERLGSDREHTLYVGDSQVDVATARNAGLDMVTVLWGFRDRKELTEAGATTFIEKPMELLAYLPESAGTGKGRK